MRATIIEATIAALSLVTNPRLFYTERGYQGVFFCELQRILQEKGIVDGFCILEMEYQKGSRHITRQRPDIILHVPVEVSGGDVTENNFAVWALKRGANAKRATEDFRKLDEMFRLLNYPLGFFVNIASMSHHIERYKCNFQERLVGMAVNLIEGVIVIKWAYWFDGEIREASKRVRLDNEK